jgi:hypothetical protein
MISAAIISLLLGFGSAHAVGTVPNTPIKRDVSSRRYVNDLDSADPHIRLFAARVLLRRTREAARNGAKESNDMRALEGRQLLSVFDRTLAPQCMRQLKTKNIVRPCVQILGLLETSAALAPLQALLQADPPPCLQRATRHAISRIRSTP